MLGARRAVIIEPGQCQQVRGLYICGLKVAGGEDVHRVTLSAAARPKDLARQLASDAGRVSRMRGNASVRGAGGHDDQAGARELLR
jgi:hypothetical protein